MHLIDRYQRNFEDYVRRHTGLILVLAAFFVIGVIFGGLAVHGVGERDRAEVVAYLSEPIERIVRPGQIDSWLMLKLSMVRTLKQLGFLWLAGISLMALPCTAAGALVLGFVSGFTVSFLTAELGWSGLALAVIGHVPHNLIALPALMIGGTAAAAFSLQVLHSWRKRQRVPNFNVALARFTVTLLGAALALLAAGLVEAYVSPALARLAASLLQV